jgi:NADP-dependent alcohol dehydrogenase
MFNFTYQNPVRVHFGKGQIAAIGGEIPTDARVLVTYGGGSVKTNGTLDEVREALGGRTVFEFGGIEPNPVFETLMKAVELCREEGIDFLLAVGGGSVIDGTKFIAAAVPYAGDPWDILAKHGQGIVLALPLGAVLTLPATGSEMNMAAVVTRKATQDKLGFLHPAVFPKFSVLDPTKTYTLPPRQIGNGVVDAFAHVMEQYMTEPSAAAVQDRWAEGVLMTLIEEGPKALETPQDYDVRANVMWAATTALNGAIAVGVPQDWSTHMIGHEITAIYGLDHGQTLAIVMPANFDVRRGVKKAKLLQYAARVWGIAEGSDDEIIDMAIARTRAFFESMGVKTRLRDYGVEGDYTTPILEALKRHGMTAIGEKQDLTPEVAKKILALCA